MDSQKVTIVMISENKCENTLRALESIAANSRPPDRIIVGDNNSHTETYAQLCKYLGAVPLSDDPMHLAWPEKFDTIYRNIPLTIFTANGQNKSSILNASIRLSLQDTSIYGFLDQHSWYNEDTIAKVIETFMMYTFSSCIVSNGIQHVGDGIQKRMIKKSYNAKRIREEYEYDENMFVASQAIQRLQKGFDESLEHMFDYDMLVRLCSIGMIYHLSDFLYETNKGTPTEEDIILRKFWMNQVHQKVEQRGKNNGTQT